ncbi:MAG: hypothetical protein L0312_12060 [Acidobacteria bacterium]|nr:hypothetical protein [Acidobacteriota bacterium]
MEHRHLKTGDWSLEAIDSALERGNLADWRELFQTARKDVTLAQNILRVASAHDLGGASELARHLVLTMWPQLGAA